MEVYLCKQIYGFYTKTCLEAACSGIVGASGPTAAGFALAARHLRPGKIAVSFFGEGAMNQGMLLESLNLAIINTPELQSNKFLQFPGNSLLP
ncbi:Acetoin dehydrogenase E1 component alpha-subunit (EC [Olavius sp. associated proteobacterium Delta 1]|nr:Acetoin dehydrogenase E1 component alpha-subunit (EC [Olavius sp. associated proteobacterium Delta 1]